MARPRARAGSAKAKAVHSKRGGAHRAARAEVLANATHCFHCSRPISDDLPMGHPDKAEADHIIPVSLGGPNVVENYVPSCHTCNSSRGNKDPKTWRTPDVEGGDVW